MIRPLVALFAVLLLLPTPLQAGGSGIRAELSAFPGVEKTGPIWRVPLPEGVTMQEAEESLETGTGGHNLYIANRFTLGSAIAKRRHAPFPAYNIYHLCNLTVGAQILDVEPLMGAYMPCKVVIYEDAASHRLFALHYDTVHALRHFPGLDADASQAVRRITDGILSILLDMAEGM